MVPVSFGIRIKGNRIILYFHGANKGHKADLIRKTPQVCMEGDIFYRVEETGHGITTRYESVMGFGVVRVAEGDEMMDGLRAICEHYGYPEYPLERCKSLPMTAVYKIELECLTGKRNLPEAW